MLQYLRANNTKIKLQDNNMQSNKSSYESNINHSQKIGQISRPHRLLYKTQSKYTKTKSRYRTGAKVHMESKPIPSYWRQIRGKKDGVPVSWFAAKYSCCKFANLPNSAGMGPGVYKTQSKHTKTKSRYRTGMKRHKESKPFCSYWMQVRKRKDEYR
jgi:hypothetical protein